MGLELRAKICKQRNCQLPSREQLERKGSTELAVLCGAVADSPSADADTAEKAVQLKHEWALLVAQQPQHVLAEQQRIEAKMESLKKRMAEFLAHTLP